MKYEKCDVTVLSKPEQEWLIRYVHYDFRYNGIIITLYDVYVIYDKRMPVECLTLQYRFAVF